MNDPVIPAPLWRRLAATLYDGLLLLGIWMVALLVDTLVRDALNLERELHALRAFLFLIGLAFFGWFWTHGGQTLGMRVWRLQLRRADGKPLSWLNAAARYAAMLLTWGITLTPAMLRLPLYAENPSTPIISVIAVVITLGLWLLMRLDAQRRTLQDRAAQSEMVVLPK